MKRVVTSVTAWNDSVGKRISITYSEIDEVTGKIVKDNARTDRILVDTKAVNACDKVMTLAQGFVDSIE